MKRVRTEQIQYAVTQYLKRRQYVDTDGSLKGAKLFQSAEEMAASLTVQTESGCANVVSAAPCQSDPQQYEMQFSRLRSFLSEADVSWAKEVSCILYPLFVYLHLDMVRCGLKGAVDGFYSRFHGAFLQDGEQRATIEQLRHVLTTQDVSANPRLSAFLEHKYVVHLTEQAYNYLLRYLQSEDNGALCRALSSHLQLEVTALRRTDYQLYGGAGGATTTPNSTSSWAGVDGIDGGEGVEVPAGIPQSEAALDALQDCIKKVREGPPSLTTVCFYAFHHTEQMLNTAEVSADSRLLAAGFDSSTVKLWSLRARKLKARPHPADVSRVRLACDVLEEEEICDNPKFIVGDANRTDICQGQLGDCWLLAAIASLTMKKDAMNRVIPRDQEFDHRYAGIFHFRFWQHNKWLDVVVDDKLPTVRNNLIMLHSASNNEFWSALLEKAYAKMHGSYESLKGGSTMEAMEDFTGGVGEMYDTRKAPDNMFAVMKKALDRGSMMGCSIDISSSAESEAKTSTGLVKGHAYSITGLEKVNYRGRKVKLIRIRNPWGQVEWNGPWSDKSSEWDYVDRADKSRILANADDGEFWMEFEDFKKNYDKVEICNMTPDALSDSTKRHWEVEVLEGSWIRGSTAGGCRNYIDTFWTNPQFKMKLEDADDDDDVCSVVVALMQKNRRKLRKEGLDLQTIGFAMYKAPSDDDYLSKDFFRYNGSTARSKTYINTREVSERFTLPPGDYVLVPTTFQPHKEADFLIRVFSEKKATALEMGDSIEADLPEPPPPSSPEEETDEEKELRKLFDQLAGDDQAISVRELQQMLNGVLSRRNEIKFDGLSLHTCHSIINLMDVDNTGMLEFQEFKVFWEKMKKWIMLFLSFDTDRSGKMSSYELRSALKAAGMHLNNNLLQLLGLRFADNKYDIDFDDYLTCIVRLENMFRAFRAMDASRRGRVRMNMMQFLMLSMNV